jgi:hypothetical protein
LHLDAMLDLMVVPDNLKVLRVPKRTDRVSQLASTRPQLEVLSTSTGAPL